MLDPKLLASVPFNNLNAWRDFTGVLERYHRGLAHAVFLLNGKNYRILPLGDGSGGPEWLQAVQSQHAEAAKALALAPPPDLQSYSLRDKSDFASFCWILSQDLERLRKAAGIT